MKLIVIGITLLFNTISFVSAQEVTTAEDFLTDYEVTHQIDVDSTPDFGFAGERYFGTYTKGTEKPVYHHYDRSGKLLWSTESFDYLPRKPALSRSGNRVMLLRETDRDIDYRYYVTEVYDENGNHLFTSPFDLVFRCSPNGAYFYSLWGASHDDKAPLTVLGAKGDPLPVEQRFYRDASPMNDSLLVCGGRTKVTVLNVFTGKTIRTTPIKSERYFHIECSPNEDRILLKNVFEICLLNSDLDRLGCIQRRNSNQRRSIILAKVLPGTDIVGLKEFRYGQGDFAAIVRLGSEPVADVKIELPPSEKMHGEATFYGFSDKALSFENGLLIYRFVSSKPPHSGNYVGRSLVIRLSPDYKTTVSHAVLESRLYPMGKRDFVEIGEKQIRVWSLKEGK